MKKVYDFRVLGFVAILAFVLVFIGHVFVQGQVTTKGKPAKPPGQDKAAKYTWSVVILDGPGLGLKGAAGDPDRYDAAWPGWVYDDLESNVNAGVEIRRAPFDGVEKYWTRFYFEIFYPIQIDLNFIPYDAWFYPNTPDALCLYPGGYDSTDPMSMFYFMQDSYHPHPEYQNISFRFNIDRSVDQNEIDYQLWPDNYHEYLGFLSDIKGHSPNLFKPETCEELDLFEFSSIEFGGGDYGYFERIGEDTWKVVVGMEKNPFYDYSIGQGEGDDAWSTDWYNICVETQINKNKTGVTYDAIFSAQGSMDILFEVLFIRTKIE